MAKMTGGGSTTTTNFQNQSVNLHPFRFAFNFLFGVLYMNRNITEKVLGEKTWPSPNDESIKMNLHNLSLFLMACDPFTIHDGEYVAT